MCVILARRAPGPLSTVTSMHLLWTKRARHTGHASKSVSGHATPHASPSRPCFELQMLPLTYKDIAGHGLLAEVRGLVGNNRPVGRERGLVGRGAWASRQRGVG